MAHFIADLEGQRASRSTIGSKQSGIVAEAAGWRIGARIEMSHEHGRDVVRVYKTGGSGDSERRELVTEFFE
jgi:hypothetical protein